MVESGSNLRTFDLFGRILSAHMGQLAARFHRLPAGHRDRRAARTLPGMVAAVQGICLSGLRIVAPDPAARLGAVGDHHVPGLGDSHRIPDVQTGAAYRPERALMHRGEKVYADSCAVCHGDKLQGNPTAGIGGDKLIGGRGTLASAAPVKTVESYWPYATTLFDYVKRSMPFTTPGSLSDEQVYS